MPDTEERKTDKCTNLIPADYVELISYNPEFIAKIKRGQEEFETTGGTSIELENLWK